MGSHYQGMGGVTIPADERLLTGATEDPGVRRADPHVELRAVQHTYRTADGYHIKALARVDLAASQGEFLGIIGPSGCGKSTLLKIVAGLVPATAGDVRVQGVSPRDEMPAYGMVFQSPVLLPWRNVIENVTLPLEIRKVRKADRMKRGESLLALVGLSGFEARSPRELSGGMQQRVALARGLITDPPLLLLDEPFGALDALTREQLNLELMQICARKGTTTLLVTHSIPEAVFLCDRVVVLGPRPARVRGEIAIGIPRPRELTFMGTERFGNLTNRLRSLLGGEVSTS